MRPLALALALSFLAMLALPQGAFAIDATTLNGKVLTGYQGWFRCPRDGSKAGWDGYISPKGPWRADRDQPGKRQWDMDMWPDVSEMESSSLCEMPGQTRGGKKLQVFTSFAPATQQTHFRWMREHGIDGVLLQRFLIKLQTSYAENDQVLKNVIAAARDNDRVFAIEYDVTDFKGDALATLKSDWTRLNTQFKLTKARGYQHDEGRPVVSFWGIGFKDNRRINDPEEALKIINWFKSQGVRVMGGVPDNWSKDAVDSPWSKVYAALDIVQPWTVGTYRSSEDFAKRGEPQFTQDMAVARRNKQDYMPVIYPGFSWKNRHPQTQLNRVPRAGGDFLMTQAQAAKTAGARMVKIAMFDEINEATAIFKVATTLDQVPEDGEWVTLDSDGKALPNDHYLQVSGRISRLFKEK
ncbi:glycoside hydrolase family 71/99-like protein [Asticcacaulis sp. AND118]|uniref:glycoside hydrolase family 71/99-like protein n=1 Tax=Asticcacaulis sp. AND118 TaxID=2840468 RepID=UPI001CFF9FF8|nr:glycoside hydrolase family 71/99-like protein [Asticcacaulis sp. AND118]UDF05041.1 glycoside hydrolase family 71/99-like protein [Asticcacaulis sp. AND118]